MQDSGYRCRYSKPMPAASAQPALLAGIHAAGEADAAVELFTPTAGALTVRARGLSKPGSKLAAHLLPADELRVTLARGRGAQPMLTGASAEERHPLWRTGLAHLALYWLMAGSARLGSGTPEQNADVFRLIVNLLRSDPDAAALPGCASVFALKLLHVHGLLPDLHCCHRDGHAFTAEEPVFLLARGEGLIGREAYNQHYARAAGQDVPRGMLRVSPSRRARWERLLRAPLLDYPAASADLADAAVLLTLCANALRDLAHAALPALDFLATQWKLPRGTELGEMLAGL
jgi:recombinational DNA repair protein (RecF pathway)